MIAITTTYHGPTNYRGSRIIASHDGRRLTVSLDHALNADENHARAAQAWIAKHLERRYLGIHETLLGGEQKTGTMVWVFADEPCRFTLPPAAVPA